MVRIAPGSQFTVITGKDIVLVSSIDWGFLWQGPQEIATRLARAGNRVLYVENTGVRRPHWRDARRVAGRLTGWARNLITGPRQVAPNLHVYSPLVMPPFGPWWHRALNRRLLIPRIRAAAQALGMREVQLWTFLPTDTVLELVQGWQGQLAGMVYYCVADFAQVTTDRQQLGRSEEAIIARSDVVFTNCTALADRFARTNPDVFVMPFGVDLAAFPQTEATKPGPRPLAAKTRPIIGYIGGIHRHLALDLLVTLARARLDWTFVFVGSVHIDVTALAALPNVQLVGSTAHAELAHFVRDFDVCLIPYARTLYTDTVVPTKLNEYLAMGKPVVSTDLPALMAADELRSLVITAPPTQPEFEQAIERALGESDPTLPQRRRRLAEQADWSIRLEEMVALLEARRQQPRG